MHLIYSTPMKHEDGHPKILNILRFIYIPGLTVGVMSSLIVLYIALAIFIYKPVRNPNLQHRDRLTSLTQFSSHR